MKKQVKKAVFGKFFDARSPSKLVYSGAFRKILGSVSQKWISQKVAKGGPFGSAGVQIPLFLDMKYLWLFNASSS